MSKLHYNKILKNEIVRNVLMLFSGSTLAQMIPFLIYPILSRLYTPEDFGTLALFSSLMIILSVFATGKYELAIMLPKKNINAINITGFCLLLTTVFCLFTMLVVLFFGKSISLGIGNPGLYPWIFLLPFAVTFYSVCQVMTSVLSRNKNFKSIAVSRMLQSFTSSGSKLTGGILQIGRGGLISGALLGHFVSACFLFRSFHLKNKTWYKLISYSKIREQIREYIYFPKFTMLHVLTNSISSGLPVFIFTRFFSTHQTGLYSMGYNIIFIPLSLFAGALGQVLYQKISEKYNSSEKLVPLVKDSVRTILILSVIPLLFLAAFAPDIIGFLLGSEWTTSGEYLRIILPWLFMMLLTSPLSFLPNIFGKQKTAMIIELISFVLRLAALTIGVYYSSLMLGLILFSIVSFIKIGVSLLWYFRLINVHDNLLKSKKL